MREFTNRFYEFGTFRVDARTRQLRRNGEVVPLTSKIFDILLVLVENAGQTIKKDELMERVWENTFVEEGNLNRNISTLRKVLGDDGYEQRLIKTIPKHGYRFTGEVRELTDEVEAMLVEKRTSYRLDVQEEIREEVRTTSLRRTLVAIGVGAVLIALAAFYGFWVQSRNVESRAAVNSPNREQAFELYQQGRSLWQTRNGEDLHNATVLLERSIQTDSQFAAAHAALADAYAFDYRNWPKAEAEAQTAISLDPNSGEPYATIGFVRMFWEWRLSEAGAELKKAVELSPNYATAHQWYAINLFATGQAGQAALAELKRAQELEPESIAIAADTCQALYFLHRFDEAIAQCQSVVTRDKKYHNTYLHLYEIYNAKGMYDEAVDAYLKSQATHGLPQPPQVLEGLRDAFRSGGIRAFWKMRIDTLQSNAPNHYCAAQHYARLGDNDEAFRHLRMAYDERDFDFIFFLADPVFEDLRSDPRYAEFKTLFIGS